MDRMTRLEKALRTAHLLSPTPEPSAEWQGRVMRDITAIEAEQKQPSSAWLDSLFWKLTPALATLLLILGFLALKTSVVPRELTGGLFQDPFTLALISMFGV